MREVAVIGDGLAGQLVIDRLEALGVDVVWFRGGHPTVPPVGLLHRHVGRSFENEPPEKRAWEAAAEWVSHLPSDVARPLTMYRPTSHDSRLSETFDRLELAHVRELDARPDFLAECQRLFAYDDAFSVDLGRWFEGFDCGCEMRGRLLSVELLEQGVRLVGEAGENEVVERVVFAVGPDTRRWFTGTQLHDRPGELAVVERPEAVPPDVAVSRNGHLAPSPDGETLCVGATYRPRDAGPRSAEVTITECLDGIARSVPALNGVEWRSHWFGVRAVVHPDRRPLAGPTSTPGVWILAGLASKGLFWGARAAEVVARSLVESVEVPEAVEPRRHGSVSLRPELGSE